MQTQYTPTGLQEAGSHLWQAITSVYDLRPDEFRILEEGCRETDLLDVMQRQLANEPLMVAGSMGQDVVNPLIQEIRQHRALLQRLLSALKLPSEDEAGEANDRSAGARAAANARWKRGA